MRLGWLTVIAVALVWACTTPNPDYNQSNKDTGPHPTKDGTGSGDRQCVQRCQDRACGPDGCGGQCGYCPGGSVCVDGKCTQSCKPDCEQKECGPDGCGGICGVCPATMQCSDDGRCVPHCNPNCQNKECGPDGCGGSCGMCGDQQTCDVSTGKCEAGGCGTIGWVGCCDIKWLKYCENGVLKTVDCASSPKCGWDFGKKYYNCGTTGLADPTGANPKKCP